GRLRDVGGDEALRPVDQIDGVEIGRRRIVGPAHPDRHPPPRLEDRDLGDELARPPRPDPRLPPPARPLRPPSPPPGQRIAPSVTNPPASPSTIPVSPLGSDASASRTTPPCRRS